MSRRLSSWPVERSAQRSQCSGSFAGCGATRRAGRRFHALPARALRQPRAPAARRAGRAGGDTRRGPAPLGRSRLGRRAQHGQGVGRLGPRTRPAASAPHSPLAPTSCSRDSAPVSRSDSGSAASDLPDSVVYCSITGFGAGDTRARSRPQLPGLGRAARRHRPGAAAGADRGPRRRLRSSPSSRSWPRCSNASALDAAAHVVVSMTHNAH